MAAQLAFVLSYHHSQLSVTPPLPTTDFSAQTIIVTGSNVGLGLEAARHFTRLNASTVILAVRDVKKGEAAKEAIVSTESIRRPDVATSLQVWELDLASYDSVKRFAKRAETLERIDKVVENASIYATKFEIGEAGDELSIVVNVISTFLLALLLLPKLRETAKKTGITPTLSITGSFVHWITQFPERKEPEGIFKAMANKDKAVMADRYNVTKLIQLYAVRELAFLITNSPHKPPIVINISNPGFCRTEIMREATGAWLLFINVLKFFFSRTTEVGGRTLVAGAEGGPETHGQYLNDCHPGKVSPLVDREEGKKIQKRVWGELAEKLEAIQPGILNNI